MRPCTRPTRTPGSAADSEAAIRRRLPDLAIADDTEGLLAPADRWLEVPRFLEWVVAAIGATGGQVMEHCPLLAVERGARIVRVHDVRDTVQALRVREAMRAQSTDIKNDSNH